MPLWDGTHPKTIGLWGQRAAKLEQLVPLCVVVSAGWRGVVAWINYVERDPGRVSALFLRGLRANNARVSGPGSSSQCELVVEARDPEQVRASSEREVVRLSRLYTAFRHVNQAIIKHHTSEQLFADVCQALVEHGGFAVAWIGVADPANSTIRAAAISGDTQGVLKRSPPRTDTSPHAHGPTGTAFREGRPYICNDMFADPALEPWRTEVQRMGYRACAVFPLRLRGEPFGTLNVYAREQGHFDDREVELLTDTAHDVSFALDALQTRTIAEREERFTGNLLEALPGVLYLYDETGRFLRWNKNFELYSGYCAEEVGRMHPLDFFRKARKRCFKVESLRCSSAANPASKRLS